eukprot:CAMPEP_0197685700 /NCGR_PEP_ID=MMETSP1338-20131121/101344_1 /TAXON_ID=43686 ORGANISM="Pelagodinium beii, Strain RCC1491" /NCGR_SAMPLE_ID=MMETSP1338 /ASSEMBLY_ACC=CAM_ASM_000754 /LENGTH=73 /DNA_ID=CAMNT_0043267551 /DNA_START=133 /DNA_END=351 /DNA_ORIENTATION=-
MTACDLETKEPFTLRLQAGSVPMLKAGLSELSALEKSCNPGPMDANLTRADLQSVLGSRILRILASLAPQLQW